MKGVKISLIVFSVLLFLGMTVLNVWYIWLLKYGGKVELSYINEFGLQSITTPDGTVETEPIFEVSYWPNALEVKINDVFDENKDKFYYQAVQYTNNTKSKLFYEEVEYDYDFGFIQSFKYVFTGKDVDGKTYISQQPLSSTSTYEYMSDDDWVTSAGSTNKLSDDTMLRIENNGKLYGLSMKGLTKTGKSKFTIEGVEFSGPCYFDYDWNYLFSELYNSIKGKPGGTDQYITLKFGDIFEVREHVGNGRYEVIGDEYVFDNLIISNKTTALTIKFNVYDYKLDSSSDSSIGWYNGSQTYNVGAEQNGYFMGRDIINVSLNDFDLIVNSDTNVATIKLNENFVNYYSAYTDKIYLNILIDTDVITENGYTFGGVVDEDLDMFSIKSFKIQYLENGDLVEVDYEY